MWLHSSIGRASHRYRGSHGFESRWNPDFFRLLLSNCLHWKLTAMIILHFQKVKAAQDTEISEKNEKGFMTLEKKKSTKSETEIFWNMTFWNWRAFQDTRIYFHEHDWFLVSGAWLVLPIWTSLSVTKDWQMGKGNDDNNDNGDDKQNDFFTTTFGLIYNLTFWQRTNVRFEIIWRKCKNLNGNSPSLSGTKTQLQPPQIIYDEYVYWYQTVSTSPSWLKARSYHRKSLI